MEKNGSQFLEFLKSNDINDGLPVGSMLAQMFVSDTMHPTSTKGHRGSSISYPSPVHAFHNTLAITSPDLMLHSYKIPFIEIRKITCERGGNKNDFIITSTSHLQHYIYNVSFRDAPSQYNEHLKLYAVLPSSNLWCFV